MMAATRCPQRRALPCAFRTMPHVSGMAAVLGEFAECFVECKMQPATRLRRGLSAHTAARMIFYRCRVLRASRYLQARAAASRREAHVTSTRAASGFLEAITHAVKRFDHLEVIIHDLEFLAQALDVA